MPIKVYIAITMLGIIVDKRAARLAFLIERYETKRMSE